MTPKQQTELAKQIAADLLGEHYTEDPRLDDLSDSDRDAVHEMILDIANHLDDSMRAAGGNVWPWGETL